MPPHRRDEHSPPRRRDDESLKRGRSPPRGRDEGPKRHDARELDDRGPRGPLPPPSRPPVHQPVGRAPGGPRLQTDGKDAGKGGPPSNPPLSRGGGSTRLPPQQLGAAIQAATSTTDLLDLYASNMYSLEARHIVSLWPRLAKRVHAEVTLERGSNPGRAMSPPPLNTERLLPRTGHACPFPLTCPRFEPLVWALA